MRHLIASVGDIHAGSTIGLHSGMDTQLDDGGLYVPSAAQEWLWNNWLDYVNFVRESRKKGDKLHLHINGDLFDGDHHHTPQIVSSNPLTQQDIAKSVLKPMLDLNPDSIIVVRGTEVHVGQGGSAEEGFARGLASQYNVITDDVGNFSHWHFSGLFHNTLVDATHHGRMGTMPWTKAGAVGGLAAKIFMEHAMRDERHPDLALRSHYHKHVDTYDQYPTRVIQLPAWQLTTGFGHRVSPEVLADVGGILTTVEEDGYTVEKRLYAAQRPTVKVF